MKLDDPKWQELDGAYRVPYNPAPALKKLQQGGDIWDELWENLHHQGDVGEASYAAVPHLVRIAIKLPSRDWNFYGIISTIEIERHHSRNPPLPLWLIDAYEAAWQELFTLALSDLKESPDELTIRSILGVIALAKKDFKLGAVLAHSDESEIDELFERYFESYEDYTNP